MMDGQEGIVQRKGLKSKRETGLSKGKTGGVLPITEADKRLGEEGASRQVVRDVKILWLCSTSSNYLEDVSWNNSCAAALTLEPPP